MPGLQKACDTDALITSNFQSIYIDYDRYLNERYWTRLRFSLAHEIGHFILHKGVYASLNIKNFKDYYKFNQQIPREQYGYFEVQANKFASYLLVPREALIITRDKELRKHTNPDWFKRVDRKTLNSYLAIPISKIFDVSDNVVAYALDELDV